MFASYARQNQVSCIEGADTKKDLPLGRSFFRFPRLAVAAIVLILMPRILVSVLVITILIVTVLFVVILAAISIASVPVLSVATPIVAVVIAAAAVKTIMVIAVSVVAVPIVAALVITIPVVAVTIVTVVVITIVAVVVIVIMVVAIVVPGLVFAIFLILAACQRRTGGSQQRYGVVVAEETVSRDCRTAESEVAGIIFIVLQIAVAPRVRHCRSDRETGECSKQSERRKFRISCHGKQPSFRVFVKPTYPDFFAVFLDYAA